MDRSLAHREYSNCKPRNAPSIFIVLRRQSRHNRHVFQRSDVAADGVRCHDFAEQPPHDFPASCFRQRLGESNFFGTGKPADFVRDPLPQFLAKIGVVVVARAST